MKLTNQSLEALHTCGVPTHMHGGIIRYYEQHLPPGDFLRAVIENDLKAACGMADTTNRDRLWNFVSWFFNHAPHGSWGRPGAVNDWIKSKR